METEINQVISKIANQKEEICGLMRLIDEANSSKMKLAQLSMDLAESRTFICAIGNLCLESVTGGELLTKLRAELERMKINLQQVSEVAYTSQMDLKKVKSDLSLVRQGMDTATKNSGSLLMTLAKLKSRIETHRHRTIGAEQDVQNSSKNVSLERERITKSKLLAENELDLVSEDQTTFKHSVAEMYTSILTELEILNGFVDHQIRDLGNDKRPKLSAA